MLNNNCKIPAFHSINTDGIVIEKKEEALITLPESAPPLIVYEPKYFNAGVECAVSCCKLREGVYELLCKALLLLPSGYGFKIYDAWRPFGVQQALYNARRAQLIAEYDGLSGDALAQQIRRYVSEPICDAKRPFVHSTGGALDLTIIDENGEELNMGCDFDEFSEVAATDYFERNNAPVPRENRRLLYSVMTSVGFTNYPSEWWHYDYGDLFWGAESGYGIAFYEGVFE